MGICCWKNYSPVLSCLFWTSTLPTHSASTWPLRCIALCQQKASATCALCLSAQSLPLWPLTTCIWERDPSVTISLIPLDCIRFSWLYYDVNNKMKCRLCLCCWGQWSWIYLQQLEKLHKSICFFASEIWTLNFLLHEKVPYNDYFGGSFPIRSGLFFFLSEFILKSGQNLFKMLYLPVNCILTKRRKKHHNSLFDKKLSDKSWNRKQIPGPS